MTPVPRPHWKKHREGKPLWQRLVYALIYVFSLVAGGRIMPGASAKTPQFIRPLFQRIRTQEASAAEAAEMVQAGIPSEPVAVKTHAITSEESLWEIAEMEYGVGEKWIDIWQANRSDISDNTLIEKDSTLIVPEGELHSLPIVETVVKESREEMLPERQGEMVKQSEAIIASLDKLSHAPHIAASVREEIESGLLKASTAVNQLKTVETVPTAVDSVVGVLDAARNAIQITSFFNASGELTNPLQPITTDQIIATSTLVAGNQILSQGVGSSITSNGFQALTTEQIQETAINAVHKVAEVISPVMDTSAISVAAVVQEVEEAQEATSRALQNGNVTLATSSAAEAVTNAIVAGAALMNDASTENAVSAAVETLSALNVATASVVPADVPSVTGVQTPRANETVLTDPVIEVITRVVTSVMTLVTPGLALPAANAPAEDGLQNAIWTGVEAALQKLQAENNLPTFTSAVSNVPSIVAQSAVSGATEAVPASAGVIQEVKAEVKKSVDLSAWASSIGVSNLLSRYMQSGTVAPGEESFEGFVSYLRSEGYKAMADMVTARAPGTASTVSEVAKAAPAAAERISELAGVARDAVSSAAETAAPLISEEERESLKKWANSIGVSNLWSRYLNSGTVAEGHESLDDFISYLKSEGYKAMADMVTARAPGTEKIAQTSVTPAVTAGAVDKAAASVAPVRQVVQQISAEERERLTSWAKNLGVINLWNRYTQSGIAGGNESFDGFVSYLKGEGYKAMADMVSTRAPGTEKIVQAAAPIGTLAAAAGEAALKAAASASREQIIQQTSAEERNKLVSWANNLGISNLWNRYANTGTALGNESFEGFVSYLKNEDYQAMADMVTARAPGAEKKREAKQSGAAEKAEKSVEQAVSPVASAAKAAVIVEEAKQAIDTLASNANAQSLELQNQAFSEANIKKALKNIPSLIEGAEAAVKTAEEALEAAPVSAETKALVDAASTNLDIAKGLVEEAKEANSIGDDTAAASKISQTIETVNEAIGKAGETVEAAAASVAADQAVAAAATEAFSQAIAGQSAPKAKAQYSSEIVPIIKLPKAPALKASVSSSTASVSSQTLKNTKTAKAESTRSSEFLPALLTIAEDIQAKEKAAVVSSESSKGKKAASPIQYAPIQLIQSGEEKIEKLSSLAGFSAAGSLVYQTAEIIGLLSKPSVTNGEIDSLTARTAEIQQELSEETGRGALSLEEAEKIQEELDQNLILLENTLSSKDPDEKTKVKDTLALSLLKMSQKGASVALDVAFAYSPVQTALTDMGFEVRQSEENQAPDILLANLDAVNLAKQLEIDVDFSPVQVGVAGPEDSSVTLKPGREASPGVASAWTLISLLVSGIEASSKVQQMSAELAGKMVAAANVLDQNPSVLQTISDDTGGIIARQNSALASELAIDGIARDLVHLQSAVPTSEGAAALQAPVIKSALDRSGISSTNFGGQPTTANAPDTGEGSGTFNRSNISLAETNPEALARILNVLNTRVLGGITVGNVLTAVLPMPFGLGVHGLITSGNETLAHNARQILAADQAAFEETFASSGETSRQAPTIAPATMDLASNANEEGLVVSDAAESVSSMNPSSYLQYAREANDFAVQYSETIAGSGNSNLASIAEKAKEAIADNLVRANVAAHDALMAKEKGNFEEEADNAAKAFQAARSSVAHRNMIALIHNSLAGDQESQNQLNIILENEQALNDALGTNFGSDSLSGAKNDLQSLNQEGGTFASKASLQAAINANLAETAISDSDRIQQAVKYVEGVIAAAKVDKIDTSVAEMQLGQIKNNLSQIVTEAELNGTVSDVIKEIQTIGTDVDSKYHIDTTPESLEFMRTGPKDEFDKASFEEEGASLPPLSEADFKPTGSRAGNVGTGGMLGPNLATDAPTGTGGGDQALSFTRTATDSSPQRGIASIAISSTRTANGIVSNILLNLQGGGALDNAKVENASNLIKAANAAMDKGQYDAVVSLSQQALSELSEASPQLAQTLDAVSTTFGKALAASDADRGVYDALVKVDRSLLDGYKASISSSLTAEAGLEVAEKISHNMEPLLNDINAALDAGASPLESPDFTAVERGEGATATVSPRSLEAQEPGREATEEAMLSGGESRLSEDLHVVEEGDTTFISNRPISPRTILEILGGAEESEASQEGAQPISSIPTAQQFASTRVEGEVMSDIDQEMTSSATVGPEVHVNNAEKDAIRAKKSAAEIPDDQAELKAFAEAAASRALEAYENAVEALNEVKKSWDTNDVEAEVVSSARAMQAAIAADANANLAKLAQEAAEGKEEAMQQVETFISNEGAVRSALEDAKISSAGSIAGQLVASGAESDVPLTTLSSDPNRLPDFIAMGPARQAEINASQARQNAYKAVDEAEGMPAERADLKEFADAAANRAAVEAVNAREAFIKSAQAQESNDDDAEANYAAIAYQAEQATQANLAQVKLAADAARGDKEAEAQMATYLLNIQTLRDAVESVQSQLSTPSSSGEIAPPMFAGPVSGTIAAQTSAQQQEIEEAISSLKPGAGHRGLVSGSKNKETTAAAEGAGDIGAAAEGSEASKKKSEIITDEEAAATSADAAVRDAIIASENTATELARSNELKFSDFGASGNLPSTAIQDAVQASLSNPNSAISPETSALAHSLVQQNSGISAEDAAAAAAVFSMQGPTAEAENQLSPAAVYALAEMRNKTGTSSAAPYGSQSDFGSGSGNTTQSQSEETASAAPSDVVAPDIQADVETGTPLDVVNPSTDFDLSGGDISTEVSSPSYTPSGSDFDSYSNMDISTPDVYVPSSSDFDSYSNMDIYVPPPPPPSSSSYNSGGGGGGFTGGGGGGSVICTVLYNHGWMEEAIWRADEEFGRKVAPEILFGYHLWAKPVARAMEKSAVIRAGVALFALPWAREMAHQMGVLESGSYFGKILMKIGIPFCYHLGVLMKTSPKAVGQA